MLTPIVCLPRLRFLDAVVTEYKVISHAHHELKNARYVVFVDDARRYVDCSEGVCELLGYTRGDFLKKRIDDISYDVAAVSDLFSEYLRQGALQGEFALQTKAKSPVLVKYESFVFSDGFKAAVWEPIKDWREIYLAAVAEIDSAQLQLKVEAARSAMQSARKTANATEKSVLDDAAAVLDILSKPKPDRPR